MLDFSNAFDLINHHLLIEKLNVNGIPPHVLRWMATFLLDTSQTQRSVDQLRHTVRV